MLQPYLTHLLARPDAELPHAASQSPAAFRRYLEAIAAGTSPRELAEQDGAGVALAQDLARLAAARERELLEGLLGYTRDPATLLGLVSAIVAHFQAWREAAVVAEQAAAAARLARLDHDMRSPLGAILGAIDVLEASGAMPSGHRMATVVRQNAERLADMIEASGIPPASKAPLVRLCEPDPSLAEILKLFLEQAGYRVLPCPGEAAEQGAVPVALTIADASQAGHHGGGGPLLLIGGPPPLASGGRWLAKPFKKAAFLSAIKQALDERHQA